MATEKKQCAGRVRPMARWAGPQVCLYRGTLEHDGKWWCKTHHPPTVAAKGKAQRDRWAAKSAAQSKARSEAKAAQAELERRSRAYDAVMDSVSGAGAILWQPSYLKRMLENTK